MGGLHSASHSLSSEVDEAGESSQARREKASSKVVRREGEQAAALAPAPIPREMRGRQVAKSGAIESSNSIEIPLDADADGTPRAAWASLPPPARTFARYGILGRLAVGGMAEIFLAREQFQGDAARHLAIKVLRNQAAGSTPQDEAYFEQMFLREGRVAMQLAHPNICHTYEFGKHGGHFFIVMEWIEGLPIGALLERAVRSRTELPLDVVLYVGAQVAAALDYAHSARDAQRRPLGVVHRDVSPHNIMLRYDGVVKLLDFGVAQAEHAEEETTHGTVKGKFGYMAPEYCAGRPIDGRADVFSLGVCLFEMLTSKRLYRRGSQYETFRAIVEEPPPSVRDLRPELPEEVDAVLACALAKDPDERFDAAALMEALVSLASREGFVLSAVRARRWLEQSYGDDLLRGPTLEVDPRVLGRLDAKEHHPTLSSAPPPALGAAERARAHAADRASPVPAWRYLVLGGLLAFALGGGLWWFAEGTALLRPEPSGEQTAVQAAPSPEPARPAVEPSAPPSTVAAPPAEASVPNVEPSSPATQGQAEPASPPTEVEREASRPGKRTRPRRRGRRKGARRPGFVVNPGF